VKQLTPIKAIRAKCIDCSAGSTHEVRICHITDCPLHPYRFGHNPKRAGISPKFGKFRKKSVVELGFHGQSQKEKETGRICGRT
jgi:hypothetical protein